MRTYLKAIWPRLRHEMKHDMASLEARLTGMHKLPQGTMIIKPGGMMFEAVGVILTAMRLIPRPYPTGAAGRSARQV